MTQPTSHTAPSGFTFTLRAPERVPERLRRPVTRKLIELSNDADDLVSDGTSPQVGAEDLPAFVKKDRGITAEVLEDADELHDLLAVALVVEWSEPFPVTVEGLGELAREDYDVLRRAVAPSIARMLPDFGPSPAADSPSQP